MSCSHNHDDSDDGQPRKTHHSHEHFTFPRNRMFPPLVETATWSISANMFARVVRVAPKSGFPSHTGMIIKVLRGETNEVPTPLAPCKAVRSCKCPDYIQEVIAGSEGAILLVAWEKGCASELLELESNAKKVEYQQPDAATNAVHSSFSLLIVEGETYVGEVQFHQATPGNASSEKKYDKREDGVFGEVGLLLQGPQVMTIEWNRLDDAADAAKRILKIPAGYEYGPFYAVNPEGYLERSCSGQLVYAPHRYAFPDHDATEGGPSNFTWATVRLPVVKADVAGPHRHCYT